MLSLFERNYVVPQIIPSPCNSSPSVLLGRTHPDLALILLWGQCRWAVVSTWCHHERSAKTLVTSGAGLPPWSLCLLLSPFPSPSSCPIRPSFESRAIKGGLKGQSQPSLSFTWGLMTGTRKGGPGWARTTPSSTWLRNCYQIPLPTKSLAPASSPHSFS